MAKSHHAQADELARLVAQDNELKAQATKLDSTLADINAGIVSVRNKSAIDAAARDLLEGSGLNDPNLSTLHQRQQDVIGKLRIIRRAIELNRRDLDEARAARTRQISEAARSEYVGKVRRIKDAVTTLLAALADEAAFCDGLIDAGGSMGCGVLYPMGIDFDPTNWLADARHYYGI